MVECPGGWGAGGVLLGRGEHDSVDCIVCGGDICGGNAGEGRDQEGDGWELHREELGVKGRLDV